MPPFELAVFGVILKNFTVAEFLKYFFRIYFEIFKSSRVFKIFFKKCFYLLCAFYKTLYLEYIKVHYERCQKLHAFTLSAQILQA